MHVLEENYLRSIILLNTYIEKMNERFLNSGLTQSDFAKKHPAYSDLNNTLYHSALMQAKKLWEAKIRYNILDADWRSISDLRNEVAHAKDIQSQSIKEIEKTVKVHDLFDKITASIYEKYLLNDNLSYQEEVEKYINDIKNL